MAESPELPPGYTIGSGPGYTWARANIPQAYSNPSAAIAACQTHYDNHPGYREARRELEITEAQRNKADVEIVRLHDQMTEVREECGRLRYQVGEAGAKEDLAHADRRRAEDERDAACTDLGVAEGHVRAVLNLISSTAPSVVKARAWLKGRGG